MYLRNITNAACPKGNKSEEICENPFKMSMNMRAPKSIKA